MDVLGIETSCDDTCVALISDGKLVHNFCKTQDHNKFGGVFPEYASRNHISFLATLVEKAMSGRKTIDLIAVTNSPGLLGSLIVGVNFAKALALSTDVKLSGINHIEGHILSAHYDCPIDFPYGVLLVSGGHTILAVAEKLGKYQILGTSLDDAAGECFDKIARELGLPQPGGPSIEILAKKGQISVDLPIPLHKDNSCNFSFSGLKTAAIRAYKMGHSPENVASSLQEAIASTLSERLMNAFARRPGIKVWALVGGVAANRHIYQKLSIVANKFDAQLVSPALPFCTDNGVMIAYTGLLYAQKDKYSDLSLEASAQKGLRASFIL